MKVTVTNLTSDETFHVPSLGGVQLTPGRELEVSRSASDLESDLELLKLVAANKLSLAFELEEGEGINLGPSRPPMSYADAVALPGADSVPAFTFVWVEDVNHYVYSDGAAWRDGAGVAFP